MTRPLLLDLFCCAGGAARGYHDAGFDILGIDINPQPRYPYAFLQGDALQYLAGWLADVNRGRPAAPIAAIHASPPCQAFSTLSDCVPGTRDKYPNLIPQTRELLQSTGLPYVIENVPGSPLTPAVTLCGSMFGLRIRRHRLFESNILIPQPDCRHNGYVMNPHSVAGRRRMREMYPGIPQERAWRHEMGVTWMSQLEAREAIPPVFTNFIGGFLLQAARQPVAA